MGRGGWGGGGGCIRSWVRTGRHKLVFQRVNFRTLFPIFFLQNVSKIRNFALPNNYYFTFTIFVPTYMRLIAHNSRALNLAPFKNSVFNQTTSRFTYKGEKTGSFGGIRTPAKEVRCGIK